MSSQPSMIYKAVKNYISNELGISKEDIVGVMNNVIQRHVHRQLSNGDANNLIHREVRHVISNMMSRGVAESWYRNNTSFEDYVKRQVREEVSKIVQESISVQIITTPPTQQEDRQ